MHEYYQRRRDSLKKTMHSFLTLIAPELEAACGVAFETAFSDSWAIYEWEMLEHFPYIGGDDASGTKNLTEAYMLVAMGELLGRCGTALEERGRLMTLAYERRMQKMPALLRRVMGKAFTSPKLLNRMFLKKDAQNAANAAKHPGSFVTQTQLPPEPGYDFSYHNLVCPLANFARQYGYLDYLPYLCNLDYVMFWLLNVPLFREHTCAEEDGLCDFKLKLCAQPMPYWPPVFSQGNGYR